MSGHTAGPWRTMFTGTGWTVNYDGPDHHWLIATVNETPAIGNHAQNADLIASAPELLAALKGLLDMITDNRLHGDEVYRASDAIKQAEGRK